MEQAVEGDATVSGGGSVAEEGPPGRVKEEGRAGDARPSSPEPSCSICLDSITDAAYTDMCFHKFCFHCLVSWSRVRPECPLCKQRFSFIIHNVRSLGDYDELPVSQTQPLPLPLDTNFFISVAFQRPRFRYRTTQGWGWRINDGGRGGESGGSGSPGLGSGGGSVLSAAPGLAQPSSVPSAPSSGPYLPSSVYMGNTVAMEWRRRRQVSASEFRGNIYRHNQWVRPPQPRDGVPYRIRETSPDFYRNNPAQVNRLIPWLHRELLVLLDVWHNYEDVCQRVLDSLTAMPIRSYRFRCMMWPYLQERTDHFIHELYHFASSPYDMLAYDLRAEYVRRDPECTAAPSDALPPATAPEAGAGTGAPNLPFDLSEDRSDSSDVEIIETPAAPPELIEISDDDEDVVPVEENHSDASVEIISTLPPLSQRTPEVIDLMDSDGSGGDGGGVCDPLSDTELQMSFVRSLLNPCYSPPPPLARGKPCDPRLRKTGPFVRYAPFYKEESSSTDQEIPRRRQLRKRKRKSERPKKRAKLIGNNRLSDDSSTDEEAAAPRLQQGSGRRGESREQQRGAGRGRGAARRGRCSDRSTMSSSCVSDVAPHKSDKSSTTSSSSSCGSDVPHTKRKCRQSATNDTPPLWNPAPQLPSPDKVKSEAGSDSAPSPKPRLRSVVKRVEPPAPLPPQDTTAGCSSWQQHNLRERKPTRYSYLPYFSTSDSD